MRLVVAGHRHHAEVGERQHRALRPQLLEVRVRVVDERRVAEVVDRLSSRSPAPPRGCCAPHSNAEHLLSIRPPTWQRVGVARSPRRIGAAGLEDRAPSCVDAAEQLLLEEGYAAVTSRRVARQGRAQAAARPLLLPHDGRPLPRGLPPPAPTRTSHGSNARRRATGRCAACGGSSPTPAAPPSSSSSPRSANHRKAIRDRSRPLRRAVPDAQLEALTPRSTERHHGHGHPADGRRPADDRSHARCSRWSRRSASRPVTRRRWRSWSGRSGASKLPLEDLARRVARQRVEERDRLRDLELAPAGRGSAR